MLAQGGDELVGVDVDAQVDDLEARALQHHAHQILADVVDVALDGADDDRALTLDILGIGQQRAQDLHRAFHRLGGHQHLWHEQDAVAEVLADDVHAGHQAARQDLARRLLPLVQCRVGGRDDLILQSVVQVVLHSKIQVLQFSW